MDDSDVDTQLEAALEAFEHPPEEPEEGLDEEGALLQLRKACRLIEGIEALRSSNGFHTLMVEAAFTAIERTLHFHLLEKGVYDPGDWPGSHLKIYQDGARTGLYSERFGKLLAKLRQENRAETYYQAGKASEDRAEKIIALAKQFHRHVLGHDGKTHECICTS